MRLCTYAFIGSVARSNDYALYVAGEPTLWQLKNTHQVAACVLNHAVLLEGSTPQTPSGSFWPLAFFLSACCSRLTLFTRRPTVMGPIRVHSKIAQVTTRNSSVFPPAPKTSLASATELIKNPISPRDTIALPRIAAGYSDLGLGSAVRLRVVFAAGLTFTAEASLPELMAGALREGSVFTASEALDEDFLNPNVVSLIDGNTFEMALARGMEANRTNHKPQITLAKTMRIVYTSPRQITRPVNILVMGMANPIDAKKSGRRMDSTAGE